jgi:hypothetical protein
MQHALFAYAFLEVSWGKLLGVIHQNKVRIVVEKEVLLNVLAIS